MKTFQGRLFLATERMVIDVYKEELSMRVEDQIISFNMFKEVDSRSDVNDCYRVDLVKESIEVNVLEEALLINLEASIIHPIDDEKAKKAQQNTNDREAPPYSSKSNPPIRVIESSLSSSNHHKSYKKDTKKWKIRKKKHGDHHFKPRLRGVLGSLYLKLFSGKLKARWSGLFKETDVSPHSVTKRIKVNVQKLYEYLGGELDQAKLSNPL
ncbi:hypothetical protein PanWU01x14_035800 [Parasponia andersonii]|uniref:Uncharacterized protein n=1 Tax=Parasponia andersonii TaxID=3476 RepID=A0A2P5DTB0_PARAD|nr:hypothetical protein PanWU01x14_035800 [Parasponia andersonii]